MLNKEVVNSKLGMRKCSIFNYKRKWRRFVFQWLYSQLTIDHSQKEIKPFCCLVIHHELLKGKRDVLPAVFA